MDSIGDAVIAADVEGRVVFLNPVAQALTGWTQVEAQGRALNEVFVIINETSRAKLENPVEKVFQTGNIIGLANHTILVARDGREVPIDDSAAPIRDENGELVGIVHMTFFTEIRAHKWIAVRAFLTGWGVWILSLMWLFPFVEPYFFGTIKVPAHTNS